MQPRLHLESFTSMPKSNDPDAALLAKINLAFPESGILKFPDEGDADIRVILTAGRVYALSLLNNVPHSRERSLAFSRLEESLVWTLLGLIRSRNE